MKEEKGGADNGSAFVHPHTLLKIANPKTSKLRGGASPNQCPP
jgi:hypothetical protein